MDHVKLSAEIRTVTGKKVSNLRRAGIVPVVVYGGLLTQSISLQVNGRELKRVLQQAGGAQVIDIEVNGRSLPVLAHSVERHSMRHEVLHVDFLAVRLDRPIEVQVPVHLMGESELVANNEAILMHSTDTVIVRALPDNLPQHLELDLAQLTEVGQHLTAADIVLPANVELVTEGETILAALSAPSMTLEEEEALAAAADETTTEDDEAETTEDDEAETTESDADADS